MSASSNQDAAGASPRSAGPDPHHALPAADPGEAAVTDPHHLLPEHATEPAGRRSRRRLIIVVVLILLIIAFILWRVHSNNVEATQQAQKQAAAAERPTPVQTSPVVQETVPVFLSALGTVTAYNTVTLQTRVDGQLLEVNFREGQAVHKGQLLLKIDPRPYQAAVDQAVGTLAKDEANLKNMQAEAERYTSLYEAGVVSKEQQQLEISNEGQASGSIKADQAAIEAAKVNLGYTNIYSPIDGVVGLRLVDPGNIVNTTSTSGLVVITQIHPIAVIFTLPEDQLPQVQQAMKGGKKLVVEAYDRADAHKIASGTLLTIDNQIDTTTGTAKLKAVFDNSDGSLFPNEFVNIRLILRQQPNSIVVPTAAVENGNQGDYVFVVNPGPTPPDKLKNLPGYTPTNTTTGASAPTPPKKETEGKNGKKRAQYHADIVPVQVQFTIDTNSVLVPGAVKPGQQVVVDGQEKLVDGGNVSPQQARSVPAANSTSTIGAGASSANASQASGLNNSGTPTDQTAGGQNPGQSSTSTGGAH
ncbi:MAG TPA: efflux RND transporter periplasmic adaptor subunit [Acidobacteriaceae bacterium]|jgi:multidrug efflux system membrane fusion protein|nr:efflux RND transporter periplasmic adaptor subunit [Acidobacteriaceae bacterium]